MKAFLQAAYPAAPNLASALDYQHGMMLTPDYDQREGKTFETDRDWPAYYQRGRVLTAAEYLPEPSPAPGALVVISDTSPEMEWADRDAAGRWLGWLNRTRELQRTLTTTFRKVRLERNVARTGVGVTDGA
jgi:hypothetical protein